MRVAAFVAFVLWLVSPGAASCQTSEEQIERSFHAGQQALQEGNSARAVEEFKRVLALDPTLLEAEVNLGLAYQNLFDYDLAVSNLTKALRERPTLTGPTVIVGMDYLKLGLPAKAIPFLEQALRLDPSNRDALEALASAYLGQENFREAAEQFRKIASLETDKSEALFKLGHEYLELAARLAYRGAHLYGESAWGHRFLGDLLLQRGRGDDALKEYQKAISIEPGQAGLHTARGQAYLHGQKWPDAEVEFRLELQLDARNELAWLGVANAQLAGNRPGAALEALRKVWGVSPEVLAVERDFPSIDVPRDVLRAAPAGVQDEPADPAKHFFLAELCAATGERTCLDREWKSFQSDYAAWQQQAAGADTDQDPCKAHRYSRCIDSLAARKDLTTAERLLLGKTYFTLQRYQPAADSLAQVQRAAGDNVESSYWLARTYQALGAEAYAQLQESFSASWRACQLRAEGAALSGDVDGAVREFHAALQLRPDEPELHEALGELYLDHHSDDAATQGELERALALDPVRTHTLYLLGRLYVQTKNNEKALPYLERALRLQPNFVAANSLLGTVYLRLGQAAEAIPRLQKAAASDHYGNVHYQLSLAYRKLGRSVLAQKEMALSQTLRRSYLERDEALIMGSPQPEAEPQ